jgi:hypothetical protein
MQRYIQGDSPTLYDSFKSDINAKMYYCCLGLIY